MDKSKPLRRFMGQRAVVPNKVSNAVRVREMNDVRNYNRNQQQRVFDMEKRQVQSESESIKPIDAKDAGAAFKLQTYISKVQQILSQKADLFSQLSATPFTDLNQLKGTTKQAGLLTMLVSKAEFVQAFNEMVAYVALFFKDIQLDNRVRDRMYATYFTPLIDQMTQLAQQYPMLFQGLPAPERARGAQPATRSGTVYDLIRKETSAMYSLLMAAADNLRDGIFRPISGKDVLEYAADNKVNQIFAANPPPPGPVVPSMASQQAAQAVQMSQQVAEREQQAAAARVAEIAARNPYDPRGDPTLPPQQAAAYAMIQQNLNRPPDYLFNTQRAEDINDDERAGQITNQEAQALGQERFNLGVALGVITDQDLVVAREGGDAAILRMLNTPIPAIQMYNDWITSRGVLAPPREQPPIEPAGPAPPRREEPAEPGLQQASADDIDEAIRLFVQQSNFPANTRLPGVDSSPGEMGGQRWRPITRIEQILRDAGMRAASVRAIQARIGEYNQAIPKRKPGKKPKQPGGSPAPPQQQQGGPAEEQGDNPEGSGMSGGNFFKNLNEYLAQQGVVPKKEHTLESLAGDAAQGALKWAGKTLWDTFTGNGQRRVYEPRELDFIPGQMSQFNSAFPVRSVGYGSHHRPKFAWEEQEERAGGRYVRQDRVPYIINGGLGMVNPDAEIGAYQVLRMAGEGMSGGVYLPKEYQVLPRPEVKAFGYGCDGDEDVYGYGAGGYGSLKRRLSMVNPFADSHDYHYKKVQTGYDDAEDFAYGNHEEPMEASQQAHEEEEEKPVDLDENPNPFRVRNENYKVNTGKMKKVSYKLPNM